MRIGIVRFSSLGDIVLTSPALRALHQAFPDASLEFITTRPYRELAEALPHVTKVHTLHRWGHDFFGDAEALKARAFDRLADLQGSPRSRKLRKILQVPDTLIFTPPRIRRLIYILGRVKIGEFPPVPVRYIQALRSWGVEADDSGLEVSIPDELLQQITEKWPVLQDQPIIIVPGAKHPTKQWPGDYWIDLIQRRKNDNIILVGKPDPITDYIAEQTAENSNIVNLVGKTTILELAAVMHYARCVVTVDTGPMHLAAAAGVPVAAIFGSTDETLGFYPYHHRDLVVLEHHLACRPCHPHGWKRCPLGHHRCMRLSRPETVVAAMDKLMKQSGSL